MGRVARIALVTALLAVVAVLAVAVVVRGAAGSRAAQQEAARFNATATAAPTVGLEPQERLVTVIGDNMSAVSQSARPVREWPLIVAPRIGARIVSMSTGGSGYTAKPLSWTYGGTFLTRAPHIDRDSDLVVVFGGANDQGVQTSRVSDSAINTVIAIREAAPRATVVLVGPVHASRDLPPALATVRNTLRSVAAAQKVQFVDPIAGRWVDGRAGVFRSDNVSLTPAGQQLVADRIEPVLERALAS